MGWHGTTKTLQKFCKTHLSLDFTGLMVRHGIVWDVKNPSPKTGILHAWCPLQDLNPPPPDYKSGALPDELNGLTQQNEILAMFFKAVKYYLNIW